MSQSTAYTIAESEDGQFSLIPQPLTETISDPCQTDHEPEQETSMPDSSLPDVQQLLTLTELESLTGIKYVTLQRLAQRHADQIPSEGAGRSKRYYPEAVEVFKRLKAETKPGRPASAALAPQRSAQKTAGTKPKPGAKRAGHTAKMAPVSQATLEMDRAVAAFERAQLVTELETLHTIADPINKRIVDLATKLELPGRP